MTSRKSLMFSMSDLVDKLGSGFSLETVLLVFTAITSFIAAAAGILKLRRHVELPVILAKTIEYHQAPDLLTREIRFEQLTDPSAWVVNEVKTSILGNKWICVMGEPVRNKYGEFLGYKPGGEWGNRITFNPPSLDGCFLLHPEAPSGLILSFRVALRGQPRVLRSIRVFLE